MGLLSLFGGGGAGGFDYGASGAQSSPFYNESGINFNSPGAGAISDSGSSASAQPRQTSGGNQAIPDSTIPYGDFSAQPSSNIIYYVIGAIVLLAIGGYLAFKK